MVRIHSGTKNRRDAYGVSSIFHLLILRTIAEFAKRIRCVAMRLTFIYAVNTATRGSNPCRHMFVNLIRSNTIAEFAKRIRCVAMRLTFIYAVNTATRGSNPCRHGFLKHHAKQAVPDRILNNPQFCDKIMQNLTTEKGDEMKKIITIAAVAALLSVFSRFSSTSDRPGTRTST